MKRHFSNLQTVCCQSWQQQQQQQHSRGGAVTEHTLMQQLSNWSDYTQAMQEMYSRDKRQIFPSSETKTKKKIKRKKARPKFIRWPETQQMN